MGMSPTLRLGISFVIAAASDASVTVISNGPQFYARGVGFNHSRALIGELGLKLGTARLVQNNI
jgi:hypothetical protein